MTLQPNWLLNIYSTRDFTLSERLLTESRVLLFYLKMILLPRISDMGLYHDDIPLSTGIITPPTTLLSILAIFILISLSFLLRNRAPLLSFGLFFFFIGHILESTIYPLEIAHEHRNYVPIYGIILALMFYLLSYAQKQGIGKILKGTAIAVIFLSAFTTSVRAKTWGDLLEMSFADVKHHPNSARSHYSLGLVYWSLVELNDDNQRKYINNAHHHFTKAAELSAYHSSGSLIATLMLADKTDSPVALETLNTLTNQLTNYPLSPFSANSLIKLGQCHTKNECSLPPILINSLFDAAINNPSSSRRIKAKILASAVDIAVQDADLERALPLATKAVELDPDHLQHYLNLSLVLIYKGNIAEGEQLIRYVEDKDSAKAYSDQTTKQKVLLEETRQLIENTTPATLQ